MTEPFQVFLSYSRNDPAAADAVRAQLESAGLPVFKDTERIREGDLWLTELQKAVDGCGAFVVLVGGDGVQRWVGAETQAALNRYFGPHDDAERLPIFPILLGETQPETLPAFLRLFQATHWDGTEVLPDSLLEQIRARTILADKKATFEGCPFVGLDAYRIDQARLFFGRQRETLDALARFERRPGFPTVRWLEINGNSGSGKSSLMNAGILPLVDQGWLWPRTGFAHWRRFEAMMPGQHPVEMLAEKLARATDPTRMGAFLGELMQDDNALRFWLRGHTTDDSAFLLAIDQFEELFTFADPDERRQFDRLLAAALEDPDCPLFVISTVRADFLDRFEDLPRLVAVRNRLGKPWTLPPVGAEGLREIIDGPAHLARLNVDEVRDAIIRDAEDEPGALPLVENVLHWLWEPERRTGDRLSGRLFTEHGGLAGILSRSADDMLSALKPRRRERALALLFRMVQPDPEGPRHARRRIPLAEAVEVAGGGEDGHTLVDHLAGRRTTGDVKAKGPLRLITVTEETDRGETAATPARWVNLIHETLIRAQTVGGEPQPYWPTLWDYIESHKAWAAWHARLKADMQTWIDKGRKPGLEWSHERVSEAAAVIRSLGEDVDLTAEERAFLGPFDQDELLAALERRETSHRERAFIGERLVALGDPRRGVGTQEDGTPDIDWRPVAGGKVVIAVLNDPLDPAQGIKEELPRRVAPFHMARYPVTVVQYRAFLDAEDGWRDRQWWGDDLYREEDGDTYDVGRFKNHPAVYVSWFDALAFCRWLSRRLGYAVRLPDEWEWQQVATGGDPSRVYPWPEDSWSAKQEPHRANTFESRLGRATAVGMYPAGASSGDVVDLAGTVWEWGWNKFDLPDVTDSRDDDFDSRVLRGGSWDYLQVSARVANRNWNDPLSRFDLIGFRVVCSSPSSER